MKKLAENINKIEFSGIRQAFSSAQKIKNPIDLSIGQPDFDVPEKIKKAAIQSIKERFNHYTPTGGINELKEKIVNKLAVKNNIKVNADQILITPGTTAGIFLSFFVLLNPGDEVILLEPYFVVYKQLANFLGAKVKSVSTFPDFQPKVNAIKKAITKKTKLIILNSPNNPTGAVYKKKDIREIVKVASKNKIFIISDEVYEDFIYEGKNFSPASIYKNTITLNGFSKSFSMTGWRIGYVVASPKIILEMTKLQQFTFVCAPSFAQKAALTALDYDNKKEISQYKRKRNILYNGLKKYYPATKPEGAFYMFLKVPSDEREFVKKLLKKKIIVVPGSVFSKRKNYIRISFATKNRILRAAVKIFQKLK